MQLGCWLDVFAPHPPEVAISTAALCGVRSVGISLTVLSRMDPLIADASNQPADASDFPDANLDRWKQALDNHGLEVAVVGLDNGTPLLDRDVVDLETALRRGERLGARMAVITPGEVLGDDARRRLPCLLRDVAALASQRRMRLALRLGRGPTEDAGAVLHTLDAIGAASIGVEFDPASYLSLNAYSSGEVAVQRLYRALACLRLRDCDGAPGGARYPPLGEGGAIEFARLAQFLRPLEFAGPGLIDFDVRPGRSLTTIQAQLQQSLKYLHLRGWPRSVK